MKATNLLGDFSKFEFFRRRLRPILRLIQLNQTKSIEAHHNQARTKPILFHFHPLNAFTKTGTLLSPQDALLCAPLYSGLVCVHLLPCVHLDEPVDRTATCSTALPGVLRAERREHAERNHFESNLHHHDWKPDLSGD